MSGSIPDEAPRDPYAPRPIDLATPVPLEPGADLSVLDEAKILAAPSDPADRPAWRAALHRWRTEARRRTGYDGSAYDDPDRTWAASAWNVAMVWLWDEVVRDWDAEAFDADRLLRAYAAYGGLDAVVLWHAYPVIGVDERHQFDWYDVPGLEALVDDLHARGVRVFVDYNPWDTGTRRTGASDADALAAVVERLGVDGIFLDTLKEGDPELLGVATSLTPARVLEGESRVPLARVRDHQASWAQWFADSDVPGVLRARWFEPRHQMHHTRRWDRHHGAELRSAWLNGAGVLLWDVVFGVRVDWTAADRATLRAMRRVHANLGDLLLRGAWEPLTDLTAAATAAGVVASRWTLDGASLYALANPTDADVAGPLLDAEALGGSVTALLGDGGVPAGGIAAALHVPDGVDAPPGLDALLADEAVPDAGPFVWDGAGERPEPVRVVPSPAHGVPTGDAVRPAPGPRVLPVRWRQRETGLYESAPYVGDWKPLPPRLHQERTGERAVELGSVAVDAREVTGAEYATFVRESGWRPRTPHRWLTGAGADDAPVTHVDLDDARAYAAWRGARLPTEDEWQAAAAEPEWRRASPAVREWTESEHRDGRTRWVVLKGGSAWSATGSDWYVDGGDLPPEWSVRFLLTQAGTGRSSTIGFRCAVDLP